MQYISVKEAGAKWGLGERRVRGLCQEGRVPGAARSGRDWLIPANAKRPARGHASEREADKERLELYLNPTYCDNRPSSSFSKEERSLSQAADLFLKGSFDEAKRMLRRLTEQSAGDAYQVVAQMMLYLVSSCSEPNEEKAAAALVEIDAALKLHPGYRYTNDLVGCVRDGRLESANLADVPDELVPIFAESACYIGVMDDIAGRRNADPACLELLARMVDEADSPALALYAHVALCLYHHLKHQPQLYDCHMRKVLDIALPRKWYVPLANTAYVLSWREVRDADPDAYRSIQRISGTILDNYVRSGHFGSTLPGIDAMGPEEFKIAYMSTSGLSVKDISETLGLSVYKVRKALNSAYDHTGTMSREGLRALLTKQFKAL